MSSMFRLLLVCVALAMGATGCLSASHSDYYASKTKLDKIVERWGVRTYPVGLDVALDATVAGLRASGFDIAMTNRSKGIVKTGRKQLAVYAERSSASPYETQSTAAAESFQLTAHVVRNGGSTTIRLTPRWFYGDREIRATHYRARELPHVLYAAFEEIDDAMPAGDAGEPTPDIALR